MTNDSIDYNRPLPEWTDPQLERFSVIQKEHAKMAIEHDRPLAAAAGFASKLADEILRLRRELRQAYRSIDNRSHRALER